MRITKLDGLRGIFSLMIVLLHYRENYLPDFTHQIFFIRQAYTFVDFFFVLSGYVIAYNYNSITTFSQFKTYIKKRFVRLFPLLFFTATLALFLDLVGNYKFPHLVNNVDSLAVLMKRYLDTLMFTNSSPILGKTSGMNGVSWSISSEMISYIVFGLISIVSIGKRKNIFLLLVILASAAFTIYNGEHFSTGDYGFVRGLISFNIGYFVWLLSLKKVKIPDWSEFLIPIALLFIFFIMHEMLSGIEKEMFGLGVIPIFFGVSIWLLLNTNGKLSQWLDTKPMAFLGKISFSLYLNHFFFILIVPKIVFNYFNLPQNNVTEIILFIVILFSVIVLSHYTYVFIEKKGGQFLRKKIFKKQTSL